MGSVEFGESSSSVIKTKEKLNKNDFFRDEFGDDSDRIRCEHHVHSFCVYEANLRSDSLELNKKIISYCL